MVGGASFSVLQSARTTEKCSATSAQTATGRSPESSSRRFRKKRSLPRIPLSLKIPAGCASLVCHQPLRETRDFERSHLSPFAKDRLFGSPFRFRVSREAERKMPAAQSLPAKRPSFFACSIARTEAFGNCCPHSTTFACITVSRNAERKFAIFTTNRPPSSLSSGNSGLRTVSFEPMRKRLSP